jgi:hypothetical protein
VKRSSGSDRLSGSDLNLAANSEANSLRDLRGSFSLNLFCRRASFHFYLRSANIPALFIRN